MSETKRQLQVSRMIKEEMSSIFLKMGTGIYGNTFVTISEVTVTPDLSEAKIYASLFQSDNKDEIIQKLNESNWLLRKELGLRIKNKVRKIPAIQFYNDNTMEEADRVLAILDKIKEEE